MRRNQGKEPARWVERALICLCLVGFAFPLYGYSPGIGFKLTLWRAGILLLLPYTLFKVLLVGERSRARVKAHQSGVLRAAHVSAPRGERIDRLAAQILWVMAAFAGVRICSSMLTWDREIRGIQLIWFIEGIVFVAIVVVLTVRQPSMLIFFLKAVFLVGFASVGFIALQYMALFGNIIVSLPLATSSLGLAEDARPWCYPLYGGGRIIGSFLEPNMSGTMCALYIATLLPYIFVNAEQLLYRRSVIVMALLVACIGLVGTGSRQSIVAVVVASLVTVGFFCVRKRELGLMLAIAAATVIVAYLSLGGLDIAGIMPGVVTPFGEEQENVFLRMEDLSYDPTGGRGEGIGELMDSLSEATIVFGKGENRGTHWAHNAYLITLEELGIIGLAVLVRWSILLVVNPLRRLRAQTGKELSGVGVAAGAVSVTWIVLITINWAQLNQSVSFMFLPLPLLYLVSSRRSASMDG